MYELERPETCSVARAMDILGERWTMLIMREAFYGVRRFSDMQRNLGIARNILSTRLQTLVRSGILERRLYQVEPERYEYRLTEAGWDLRPVLIALIEWGDRYRASVDGPPVLVTHADCGERVGVKLECAAGHEIEPDTRLRLTPGPGARPSSLTSTLRNCT